MCSKCSPPARTQTVDIDMMVANRVQRVQ